MGARALILSNGTVPRRELVELAESKRVTVLISPFDTSSTATLVVYSVAAKNIGDASVPPLLMKDTVGGFREKLSKAPSRCLPVADEDGKVIGIISSGDLAKEPNVEVIMVDHNEPSQAIEGIENYRILEIIDHHRIGNLSTRQPITFINRVVGATCTIVTNLYREHKVPMEKEIASILLCGILTDTLMLKSATVTETDIEAADYLSSITALDIQALSSDLQTAANKIITLPAQELVSLDSKKYTERGLSFLVSQIEIDNIDALMERKDEIVSALEKSRGADYLFAALLVTDITMLDSLLFVTGDKAFTNLVNFPVATPGVYELKGVVSRKKQLMPLLTELILRYTG
jgi:manganese-dependent inorganic pyrophosphatase